MTYTVRLHGIAVGRSDLSRFDPAAGFARGKFNPATGYQLVQNVFRLYADAIPKTPGTVANPEKLQRYYKARDALQLQVIDPDGNVVPETTSTCTNVPKRRCIGIGGSHRRCRVLEDKDR